MATHPRRLADLVKQSRSVAELIVTEEIAAAPPSSLTVPIGARRRYRAFSFDLAEVKAIKRALGGTVNDAVLAATAGGLCDLLEARGEDPPSKGLRAMVPVNVRASGEELGNHVSSLFVDLPVAPAESTERYRRTRAEAERLKGQDQAGATNALIKLAGMAPPLLHATLARALFGTRLFNITVTNVPGPQEPLFAFGARLREVHPFVPLAAEHALGIAIVSYCGRLTFGLCADYDSVPDLDVLENGIRLEFAALRDVAAVRA